jgi:HEAT repeat protein
MTRKTMKSDLKIIITSCAALMLLGNVHPARAGVNTITVIAPADHDGADDREDSLRDREEDLYDKGTDLLDDHEWRKAEASFAEVARMRLGHADGALYWKAYAENKMGQRADALSTLVELQKSYPKSRWSGDGKALELEVRQSAGQTVAPEHVDDEDIKLMAINSLLASDPTRALPLLEKVLNGSSSPKVKDRALFVLSQSRDPRAYDILGDIARGKTHHELQGKALRYLGIMGGEDSRRELASVYSSSADPAIKKSVLRSLMISGDRERILTLARTERDADLRGEAIRQLGILGSRDELADLYKSESSIEVKRQILQAMFIGGSSDLLGELAKNEKNPELRVAAIHNLGLVGGPKSGGALLAIYNTDANPEVKTAVIKAFFLQGNAKTLVDLARKEKDPAIKREIVKELSIMGSREATDYLMEYLKE